MSEFTLMKYMNELCWLGRHRELFYKQIIDLNEQLDLFNLFQTRQVAAVRIFAVLAR
jgi:hypothetical protein